MARYLLALKDRQEVAKDTMAFWFNTVGSGYTFRAGQNAAFILVDPPETDGEGNARTLSLATSPNNQGSFMVATRMRDTAFKRALRAIPIGTRGQGERADGLIYLAQRQLEARRISRRRHRDHAHQQYHRWATEERSRHSLYLFYSNRTPEEAAFVDRFESWTRENPNFKFIPTVTASRNGSWGGEFGRIDREMLVKYVPEIRGPLYCLAGPPGMVAAMRQLLDEMGVSEDSIKTEEFAGY